MKFLCAEDNELNMEIAEFMLQNEGAECRRRLVTEDTSPRAIRYVST